MFSIGVIFVKVWSHEQGLSFSSGGDGDGDDDGGLPLQMLSSSQSVRLVTALAAGNRSREQTRIPLEGFETLSGVYHVLLRSFWPIPASFRTL